MGGVVLQGLQSECLAIEKRICRCRPLKRTVLSFINATGQGKQYDEWNEYRRE